MDERTLLRTIALALRAGRRARGLSQRELAERAGVSPATVARAEAETAAVGLFPLRALLGCVGMRLAVVHDDGTPFAVARALPLDELGAVDRRGRQFPAHLPEDRTDDSHYWRTWREQRSGTPGSPWTFRRWRPSSPTVWREWNEQLWGPGAGCDGPSRFDPPSPHG